MERRTTLATVRRALAVTILASLLGTVAELVLVEHTEDLWQLLPVVLLGLATVALLAAWRWPNASSLRAVQGVMGLVIAAGVLGLWLHYRANAEFELEMYPALGGWPLFWKAIFGASPPSLAPAAMFLIGVLGLIWSLSGETA